MNLEPFESLLDELLEDLVAHHEAGLAQRKLRLKQSYLETDPAWRWMEENNLDKLLQYILSLCYEEHHEVDLAQGKLRLEMIGNTFGPINLSDQFVEKWNQRCEKVDSIEYKIVDYR